MYNNLKQEGNSDLPGRPVKLAFVARMAERGTSLVTLFLNSPELGSAAPAIPVSLPLHREQTFPDLEKCNQCEYRFKPRELDIHAKKKHIDIMAH